MARGVCRDFSNREAPRLIPKPAAPAHKRRGLSQCGRFEWASRGPSGHSSLRESAKVAPPAIAVLKVCGYIMLKQLELMRREIASIVSMLWRRSSRSRRVLNPAEARAQQQAAAVNAQARVLQRTYGAEQSQASSQHRRSGDGRHAPRPAYLAAHGVEKSFGGRMVVRGVTLYVRRGEAVGLLGPNGAGKTTVFYMITGLINADRGRIELDGYDVTALPMYQRARLGIGYLPQEASIFRGLNVEDNIRSVLEVVEPDRRRREADLNALLEEFNIARVRKTPTIALSGGERRRVEIARALATRPSYMLLDEPFAGIDPIAVGD